MRKFILELDYGTKVIENLKSTWIQPMTMQTGWMLCYEDDIYEKGIIYRSSDKEFLSRLQSKMMDAYCTNKIKVRL